VPNITANDTLSLWLNKQHEAVKRGAVAKLYYKATPQGLEPYKYIEKQGNKKIIILIGEESQK
jgi:hypothetical protein